MFRYSPYDQFMMFSVETLRRSAASALCAAAAAFLAVSSPERRLLAAGEEVSLLPPGSRVERALASGEADRFEARLDAGRPYRITVRQLEIDVVLEVRDPEGTGVVVDGPLERWGTEEALVRPSAAGTFRIEVRAEKRGSAPGRYEIALDEIEHATPAGQALVAALDAVTRAGALLHRQAPDRFAQALPLFQGARDGFHAAGDRPGEAEAVVALAAVSRRLGRLREAAGLYEEAVAVWQEIGRPEREARTWNQLGLTCWDLNDLPAADTAFARGLELALALGDAGNEADLRHNRCLVVHARGEIGRALACYREALARYEGLGGSQDVAAALHNIAFAYYHLGEPQPAEEHYRQVLAIRRQNGDLPGEAQVLNNLAVLFRSLGEADAALPYYAAAREILATLEDRRQEAAALNNLGVAYNSLGEARRARPYFLEALEIRRAVQDRRGEIVTLNNLGWLERGHGDAAAAVRYHSQALELARTSSDRRAEALSLSYLGEALTAEGRHAEALERLDQALTLHAQIGDRAQEAIAQRRKAEVLVALGDAAGALPLLDQALAFARGRGSRAHEAAVLTLRARALRNAGRLDAARADGEAAVAAVESLRSRLASPDLRASFLGSQGEAFEILIDALMGLHASRPGQGFDRAALEASERARARTLLDFLRAGTPQIRSAAPELAARRRELERGLVLKADRRQSLLGAGRDTPELKALEKEIERATAELDALDAAISRQDPRYAAIVQATAASAGEIQALLDPQTLLLEYSLGQERSYLWAVGATSLRTFVLPGRNEIERAARALHEALSRPPAPGEDRSGLGADLGRMLLGPLEGELRDRRLAIVADGALHYIPFEVLLEPGGEAAPLLRRHEVVALPSASALAATRRHLALRAPAPRLAIVLADPVFGPDDSRVSRPARAAATGGERPAGSRGPGEAPTLGRLRFSRREAEEIDALAPEGALTTELDFAASRDLVLSGRLRDYRHVHLATHGLFDTTRPDLSGIVLSRVDPAGNPRDGFVGLRDIYDLELSADLVVLSGCQTALGREIRGEGLLGLTRGFLYAGAARVVASLWWVDDRATAELMSRFYRGLWTGHLPPAAALRQARLSLAAERRFRDPFYWGPFLLQGDWR